MMMSDFNNPIDSNNLRPDLSLVGCYNQEYVNTQSGKPPLVMHYTAGTKHLYFVAANHGDSTDSPTFRAIAQIFREYDPRIAIIEGAKTAQGLSPAVFGVHGPDALGHFTGEEPAYTVYLARQQGRPFVGGEPLSEEIVKVAQAAGYSAKDVMVFYILRMIPQDRREGKSMTEESFAERAANYAPLTFEEFKTWYDSHKEGDKHFLDIQADDTAAHLSPNAPYFRKLAAIVQTARERNMVTTIADSLTHHDRVLIVYGSGNLWRTEHVLEAMLGKGEIIPIAPGQSMGSTKVGKHPRLRAGLPTPPWRTGSPNRPVLTTQTLT